MTGLTPNQCIQKIKASPLISLLNKPRDNYFGDNEQADAN